MSRLAYLARIARVYVNKSSGPLSFWYEQPTLNEHAFDGGTSYFMAFQGKAAYKGPFDERGVPLLDYRGDIGHQYNPIAIAQYGLARFNRWVESGHCAADEEAWRAVADWLSTELRPNAANVPVWMHDFDWPYRQTLVAPWYSGLAQGCGVSLLVRAAGATGDARYGQAARSAFRSMRREVSDGGVLFTDDRGHLWIEEYLVRPPSHILNGFIWALWGVYDYSRWSGDARAAGIWASCVATLEQRLSDFDTGWWTLYEAPHGDRQMLASRYYHTLHITQMRVLHRLTGSDLFEAAARRFQDYLDNPAHRARAFAQKAAFKLRHY